MNKNVVRGLLAVSGLACAAISANAQSGAPTSAQVWEVRYLVDSTGDFAAGPNATAVGITIQARVGIRANTSTAGVVNFGVSRVGGLNVTSGAAFLMTFSDPLDSAANHGSLVRGATGELLNGSVINANDGAPLAGHFAPFRGAFAPAGSNGNNTDATNGAFGTAANGNATVTSISGSRGSGNNTPGNIQPDAPGGALGAATVNGDGTLSGDFVSVYRMVYLPRFELGVTFPRNITVNVANLGVRYLFRNNGGGLFSVSTALVLPNTSFTFQVPGPGAAALVGLGGLVAARRRRA